MRAKVAGRDGRGSATQPASLEPHDGAVTGRGNVTSAADVAFCRSGSKDACVQPAGGQEFVGINPQNLIWQGEPAMEYM